MSTCITCGTELKLCFNSWYCPHDCDQKLTPAKKHELKIKKGEYFTYENETYVVHKKEFDRINSVCMSTPGTGLDLDIKEFIKKCLDKEIVWCSAP